MSEKTYMRICEALMIGAFATVLILCGYGMSKEPAQSACLQRPWLDTRGGC